MTRLIDRRRTLELGKQGKSYSQIKAILKVSKSTLSLWLQDYPLSEKRLRELRDWNQSRIENYIETRKRQRETILNDIYNVFKK